jgi:hypothetical protein
MTNQKIKAYAIQNCDGLFYHKNSYDDITDVVETLWCESIDDAIWYNTRVAAIWQDYCLDDLANTRIVEIPLDSII